MYETEDNKTVAAALCVGLAETINKVGPRFLDGYLEQLCTITVQILKQKALCQQDPNQDDADEAPEESAEYESVLISSAQDLVATIANVLGPMFSQLFATFLPLIGKYYKKNRSLSDRSAAIGCLAELIDALKSEATNWTEPLLELFYTALSDTDAEQDLSQQYLPILGKLEPLFDVVPTASPPARLSAKDNAAGAVGRMIVKNTGALPLDQVLPMRTAARLSLPSQGILSARSQRLFRREAPFFALRNTALATARVQSSTHQRSWCTSACKSAQYTPQTEQIRYIAVDTAHTIFAHGRARDLYVVSDESDETYILPDDSWIAIVCDASTNDAADLPSGFFVAPRDAYMSDVMAVGDRTQGGEEAASQAVLRFGAKACGLDTVYRDWRFPVNFNPTIHISEEARKMFSPDHTICYCMAWRWMYEFGYCFKRTHHADGHERPDVVACSDTVTPSILREARDAQRVFSCDGELVSEPSEQKPVVL
ncbi:unnamed protein product [Peniophora sp. CBMAI 1063]|nr:unnamed protein product [Peniophora sp. CBMAI 1063]